MHNGSTELLASVLNRREVHIRRKHLLDAKENDCDRDRLRL